MAKKRSVIEWTDEQHARLTVVADMLGMSVPSYVKVAALEKEIRNAPSVRYSADDGEDGV